MEEEHGGGAWRRSIEEEHGGGACRGEGANCSLRHEGGRALQVFHHLVQDLSGEAEHGPVLLAAVLLNFCLVRSLLLPLLHGDGEGEAEGCLLVVELVLLPREDQVCRCRG